MDIQMLTEKMNDFVRSKGWYEPGSSRMQSPRNLAISLCLETSEVLELFQWTDTCNNIEELESELADVSLYLLQLASVSKIDLEAAIIKKLNKNIQREWDTPI